MSRPGRSGEGKHDNQGTDRDTTAAPKQPTDEHPETTLTADTPPHCSPPTHQPCPHQRQLLATREFTCLPDLPYPRPPCHRPAPPHTPPRLGTTPPRSTWRVEEGGSGAKQRTPLPPKAQAGSQRNTPGRGGGVLRSWKKPMSETHRGKHRTKQASARRLATPRRVPTAFPGREGRGHYSRPHQVPLAPISRDSHCPRSIRGLVRPTARAGLTNRRQLGLGSAGRIAHVMSPFRRAVLRVRGVVSHRLGRSPSAGPCRAGAVRTSWRSGRRAATR
jgi:hypothetical protein